MLHFVLAIFWHFFSTYDHFSSKISLKALNVGGKEKNEKKNPILQEKLTRELQEIIIVSNSLRSQQNYDDSERHGREGRGLHCSLYFCIA